MKTKITVILSIILIMIINITTSYAISTYGVNLTINPKTIKVGETFTVTLSAKCDDGINGIDTTYTYDKDKLELVSANVVDSQKWASLGVDNLITVICNSTEKIKEADIYELKFKVKETVKPGTTAKIKTTDILLDSDAQTNSEHTITGKELTISIGEVGNPDNKPENPDNKPENPDNKPENPNNKPENPDNNQNSNNTPKPDNSQNEEDKTISKGKLPKTGIGFIIPVVILGLVILSYVLHRLYSKYKNI